MSNAVPTLTKTFFVTLGDKTFNTAVHYFCTNYKNYNANNQSIKIDDLKGKSLYRYPKINLPRTKLDMLKESHNIKVVRDPSKADYKVISDKYVESLFKLQWHKRYLAKDLHAFCLANPTSCLKFSNTSISLMSLQHSFSSDGFSTDNETFQEFLEDNPDTHIVFVNAYAFLRHQGLDVPNSEYPGYEDRNYISEDNKLLYDAILNDNTLIKDEQLVDIISSDSGVILTHEQYDSLLGMIRSADRENVALGLEMLANCNISKSLDYVSMIFYFNYDYLKDASNWNSINVKSLRQALDPFKPYFNGNVGGRYYHAYINTLAKHDYLTEFAIKEVSAKLFDDVVNRVVLGTGSVKHENVLTIDPDAIKVSENYAAKVKNTPLVNLDKLAF